MPNTCRPLTYWPRASKLTVIVASAPLASRKRGSGMRRDLDRDRLSRPRARAERALPRRRTGEAGDLGDRAEQGHDRGQVVGRDIEERAAARPVEEVGVRMPRVGPADQHGCVRAQRLADLTRLDQPAAGLVRAAEEGVGRGAEPQAAAAPPLRPARVRPRPRLRAASRCTRACRRRRRLGSAAACAAGGVKLRTSSTSGSATSSSTVSGRRPCASANAWVTDGSRSAQATGRHVSNATESST